MSEKIIIDGVKMFPITKTVNIVVYADAEEMYNGDGSISECRTFCEVGIGVPEYYTSKAIHEGKKVLLNKWEKVSGEEAMKIISQLAKMRPDMVFSSQGFTVSGAFVVERPEECAKALAEFNLRLSQVVRYRELNSEDSCLGKIVFWNKEKRYGFVRKNDEKEYFLHYSAIIQDSKPAFSEMEGMAIVVQSIVTDDQGKTKISKAITLKEYEDRRKKESKKHFLSRFRQFLKDNRPAIKFSDSKTFTAEINEATEKLIASAKKEFGYSCLHYHAKNWRNNKYDKNEEYGVVSCDLYQTPTWVKDEEYVNGSELSLHVLVDIPAKAFSKKPGLKYPEALQSQINLGELDITIFNDSTNLVETLTTDSALYEVVIAGKTIYTFEGPIESFNKSVGGSGTLGLSFWEK